MPRRGPGWDEEEEMWLLDAIEEFTPINPAEWEQVKTTHDVRFSGKRRNVKSIIRKFTELARTAEPTGDPNIPPAVRRAKEIREMITEKTDGTTGSPDPAEQLAEDEDDDEEENGAQVLNTSGEINLDDDSSEVANFFNPPVPPLPGTNINAAAAATTGAVTATVAVAAGNRRNLFPATSPKFTSHLQAMKRAPAQKKGQEEEKFSLKDMFGLMMMQQQADRERQQQEREAERDRQAAERERERERQNFLYEQMKLDRDERAATARDDRQQMMAILTMSVVGRSKRGKASDDEDGDNNENGSPHRKSPRKK